MAKTRRNADNVVRRYTTFLPHALTDLELRDRGIALAHSRGAQEEQRLEAMEVKKRLKEAEEKLEQETSRVASIIRAKSEHRETVVEVRLSSKPGFVDEVRVDTGEVLQTRKMQPGEAQSDFLETPFDTEAFITGDGMKPAEARR